MLLIRQEHLTGVQTVSKLLKNEGVAALWKGNVPAEILYVLYGALQFTSYSAFNKGLCSFQEEHNFTIAPLIHLLLVGAGLGLSSTLITYPFDLLRTRLAANDDLFLSMTKTAKLIWHTGGLRGFFAGIGPSVVSVMANTGLFFWSYSLARETSRVIGEKHQIWGVEAICGFMAGATAKGITFPLDTLRKRMQVTQQKSAVGLFLGYWKKHGFLGFYRGFAVSLMKTAPTSALSIAIYEYSITATRSAVGTL